MPRQTAGCRGNSISISAIARLGEYLKHTPVVQDDSGLHRTMPKLGRSDGDGTGQGTFSHGAGNEENAPAKQWPTGSSRPYQGP
jgi:hypothetical protein